MKSQIRIKNYYCWLCSLLGVFLSASLQAGATSALPLSRIKLPPGFAIELFASVPNARQMTLGKKTLFVGSMGAGKVYAIPLQGTRPGRPRVIAEDLTMPVGVAFYQGDLYVSAVSRILRFRDIEARLHRPPHPEVMTAQYPSDTAHGWKFIAFGPDHKLYVPVGAPCNICEPDPSRYARITRLDVNSGKLETVASGVRNSVGFDWHPVSKELWFTDNGRDGLGDNIPPDELNRLDELGQNFGYPYCHGGTILDPDVGDGRSCKSFTPPVLNLGAHVAALGMRFYTGKQFPAHYRNAIFIAEHGSWNRSSKTGYRIGVAFLQGQRVVGYEPFATGWLQNESAWGRPADVQVLPDGSLLVADDLAGVIYRIWYHETK